MFARTAMAKKTRPPNEGLVDTLLACPHHFDMPQPKSERPSRPSLERKPRNRTML